MRRLPHFLIRGFDPLIDAIEYGRELIPLTRKLISTRQLARGGRGMIRLMLAGALLFLGIEVGQAQAILRVGDQKGNAQVVMEAAGVRSCSTTAEDALRRRNQDGLVRAHGCNRGGNLSRTPRPVLGGHTIGLR